MLYLIVLDDLTLFRGYSILKLSLSAWSIPMVNLRSMSLASEALIGSMSFLSFLAMGFISS